MTRRRSRRTAQRFLVTRAPRRGTLIIAAICYAVGVLGAYKLIPSLSRYGVIALTIAGGLLILGALLRDL
jgi:hypothetical protein